MILTAFLLATHGLGLSVALLIPLDWYWRCGLAVLVLAGLLHALGMQVLFMVPWAVREAIWEPDGAWTLTLVSGDRVETRLLSSSFVSPRVLVLNFRRGRWRSRTMVLASDTLDSDLLRSLRVRLRLWGAESGSDADVLG